jgi:hypothetical protein
MSLTDLLLSSRKLSPSFHAAIEGLSPHTDPDKPLFSALVAFKDAAKPPVVKGAHVASLIGDIATMHHISLNGLKELVDDNRVIYVDKSHVMGPG